MSAPFLFPRLQKFGPGFGIGLLVLCAIIGFFCPTVFFEGYLTAFVFWVEITLGCLGLLLLQYLTGGLWGAAITRLLEAGTMTLPLCSMLFLPVVLGMPFLFSWIYPVGPELQHLVHEKAAYLNTPFYVVRYILYFLVLGALAAWYRTKSLQRDAGDPAAFPAMRKWSGPALIIFVLLMNFACVDWIMSLNSEWYSSMLVVEFVAEQAVVAMAACILAVRFLSAIEPLRTALTVKVVHDLANLLLGFTCFWTYVTFSEYLITWTGNLPHTVVWFSDRSSAGWKIFAVVLVFLHFVFPLFCLILTSISRNLVRLAWVAALLLVAHFVQVVWWIGPAFGPHSFAAWTGPILIVALGALWLPAFARNLAAAPLLPKEKPAA